MRRLELKNLMIIAVAMWTVFASNNGFANTTRNMASEPAVNSESLQDKVVDTEFIGGESSTGDDWNEEEWEDDWADETTSPWQNVVKFVEVASGSRINHDSVISSNQTLLDARMQWQATYAFSESFGNFRGQIFYDGVQDKWRGQLRELNWQASLSEKWDLKIGQQILTWGTGDYLFINDMFAKDWQSFFSGRDDEYLKAPQFAIKASGYFELANVDLVLTPQFTPDIYINGDVFSFYNPVAAAVNGGENIAPGFEVADKDLPNELEFAVRIKKQINNTEIALYGYKGFQKSPTSMNQQFEPTFSKLTVIGASTVTQLFGGLVNFEIGQHNIEKIEDSGFAYAPKSDFKAMAGYQTELYTNLNASIQFQIEGERTLWTGQLRYRMLQDTLNAQWFTFYSPSDSDGYSRLRLTYKPIQNWEFSAGANVFWGERPDTFLGQFKNASNVFVSARHYF